MITKLKISNTDMSKLMDIKSFQYIPLYIPNSIYQSISDMYRVSIGVDWSDGYYNVINSFMKDNIINLINGLLLTK